MCIIDTIIIFIIIYRREACAIIQVCLQTRKFEKIAEFDTLKLFIIKIEILKLRKLIIIHSIGFPISGSNNCES